MQRPTDFGTLVFLILLMLLPAISRLLAGLVASINGCRIAEGSTAACLIGGADWGAALRTMTAIGWLAMFTVPIAALLVIVVVVQLVKEARR